MLTLSETLREFGLDADRHRATQGIDAFSRASLKCAFQIGGMLASEDASRHISYDVLVNDLGTACHQDLCTTGGRPEENAGLPAMQAEIRALAAQHGQQVSITTERHMRNWALRRFRTLLAAPSGQRQPRLHAAPTPLGGRQWQLDSRTGAAILLFEERGDHWVGKCPAIMGGYYAYTLERMAPDTLSEAKVVIDLCSPADRDKVSKGAETAFSLLRPPHRQNDSLMPVICDAWCEHLFPRAQLGRDFLPR